nr:MAG: capsid protein [Cressdnaviricota sp.]
MVVRRRFVKRPRKFRPRRLQKYAKRRISHKSRKPGVSGFMPFGFKQAVKLHYSINESFDPGAGTLVDAIFNTNSLFRPEYDAATHQPYGFDQMALLYNNYTVLGSRVKMTVYNTGSTPLQVLIQLSNSNVSLTGDAIALWREKPGTKCRTCVQSGSKNCVSVMKSFSTRKWFNCANPVGEDTLTPACTANATRGAYFHCMVGPLSSSDPAAMTVQFDIDYYAVFTNPKDLPQSTE